MPEHLLTTVTVGPRLKFIMGAALWEDASHADTEYVATAVIRRLQGVQSGNSLTLVPTAAAMRDETGKAASASEHDVKLLNDAIAASTATVGRQSDALAELKTTIDVLVRKLNNA